MRRSECVLMSQLTVCLLVTLQRIKDDELSSRIQSMLGNYEDGPEDPALPYDPQTQSGHTDRSRAVSGPASGESWDSFPALAPPVEPLSPLRSSDSDPGPSPERRRPDAPPLTLTLPLNLHSKLTNTKKPTAYVRPMDGPDQVTSDSPEPKASLESDEQLQDLKESSKPNLAPLQAADVSVTARARVCFIIRALIKASSLSLVCRLCLERVWRTFCRSVEFGTVSFDWKAAGFQCLSLSQEMTSWPPLLTTICSPATAEPPRLLSTNEVRSE